MSLDQKRARWFGVLYLVTYVTSIPALLLYEPVLRDPVGYIAGAGHDKRILLAALLELLLILANIGTAVVIVPIMRRQSEELAIGYVTARIFECAFILVGIVSVLGIVTLRNQGSGAMPRSFKPRLAIARRRCRPEHLPRGGPCTHRLRECASTGSFESSIGKRAMHGRASGSTLLDPARMFPHGRAEGFVLGGGE